MSGQIAETPANRSSNRTEIQSNLLADRLERFIIRTKPFLPWIIGGIVAAVLIAILVAILSGQARKREANAWTEIYFSQLQPEQLEMIAGDFDGTTASLWATQENADSKLGQALMQVYLDRPVAMKLLSEAREGYEKVMAGTRDPLLNSRATLGIAKTYDAEANVEKAIELYNKVLSLPGTHEQLQESVNERLKFMQSTDGKEFYAWFSANSPANPREVGTPADLTELPDSADFQFSTPPAPPTPPAADAPATETPAVEDSTAEAPAPETAIPEVPGDSNTSETEATAEPETEAAPAQ